MTRRPRCRVLLTNGRFPVTIDLARQLHRSGVDVYCVDPMEYHMCKFSTCVRKSYEVPAPHIDAEGYIKAVRKAVDECHIDLIIPMHEEIFYLAECNDQEILKRLLAPPFETLIMLHNKWHFMCFLSRLGLDHPESHLIRSIDDVRALDLSKEWALKPVYGRAASNVYHFKPGQDIPEGINVSEQYEYIAQEWIRGKRFCTYSVVRHGRTQAFALYPVQDTIDGSSCVYFEAVEHSGIHRYVERIAQALPDTAAQLAFDFIETEDGRLVAIECNPRATSGIHLYSGTPHLAEALINPEASHQMLSAKLGSHKQVGPGMLMWKPSNDQPLMKQYLAHMKHHITTKDVMFSKKDIWPTLMQPFLLTSYYEICRERKMKLPVMFQWDVTWEPDKEHLAEVNKRLQRKLEE